MIDNFYPVVPAGGSGTRLWPLSRRNRPKFLFPLGGEDISLLQSTVRRLLPLSGPDRLLVVTGAAHLAAVREQLPDLPPVNLVAEPSPRNSAPAIALAAALAHSRNPDAITGSFAADHLIADVRGFHDAIRTAAEVAGAGLLVTVGLSPTRAETGYGYIKTGAALGIDAARTVDRFEEKPDRSTAAAYVSSGEYLWNAGMFVWRADALLAEVRRQLPDLYDGVLAIAAAYARGEGPRVHDHVWPTLPKVSIDVGIVEGAAARGRVGCVPGNFGWTDVGDWDALGGVLAADDTGTVALNVEGLLSLDSADCVVAGSGRPVVLLGVRDLVVVDGGDVVFVCPRARAQDVGSVVQALRDAGREHLT
ncbi:MAG: mannose-1-phosphate guanylyltransferase [Geodermatophilaceae bacterium]|nr:mannose-1-phosphate guanylyltransferase [Geodermatophilaceae bacterium]